MLPVRIAAALVALTTTLLAQQPSQAPIPTIRTTARLVVLDVVVSDGRGHPVRNLKPSDFTLSEDGRRQTILSVTEHDAVTDAPPPDPFGTDAFASAPAPLPPNTFTGHPPLAGDLPKTVIVLDNLAFADAPVFRDQFRAFLQTLPAHTPVALFRIDWQGLHLVQDFTPDAAQLLAAASSQRILPPGPFRTRYYRLTTPPVVALAHLLAPIPGRINLVWVGSSVIPNPNPSPDSLFGDEVLSTGPSEADRIIGQATGSLSRDFASVIRDLGKNTGVLRLSRIALYPIDARGLIGNSTPSDLLAGTTGGETFSGLGAAVLVANCQGIRAAATATGGKGFCGTNDLKGALTEAVTAGSHFYTLSYIPQNHAWNGAFRHIKVDVGEALHETALERAGDWVNLTPRIAYRDGYYARDPALRSPAVAPVSAQTDGLPQPGSVGTGSDQDGRKLISYSPKGDPHLPGKTRITPMQLAMNFTLDAPDNLPFNVTITPSKETATIAPGAQPPPGNFLAEPWRDTPYRTLKLHYSLDPQDFQFSERDGLFHNQFELVALVFRDDGALVNSAALTAPVDVTADDFERIDHTGMAFEQSIAMPASGNFYLRVGVHEINSGRIGALQVPSESVQIRPQRSQIILTPKR